MLSEIIKTAQKAGETILTFYDNDIEVVRKEDDSPLTKADLASHNIIIKSLKEIDPETPVISEESGVPSFEERKNWGKFWIVDPLDGTKEFIKKNGEFTVNIALIEHGMPTLGVVYVPVQRTTYYAKKGEGSYKEKWNESAKQIFSEKADTSRPLTVVQSRSHSSEKLAEELARLGIKIDKAVKAGSSIKFCLVAEGKADIYPRTGPTMEWDVAAGDCIYRYSAKNGQHNSPLTYNKKNLKNGSFIIGMD